MHRSAGVLTILATITILSSSAAALAQLAAPTALSDFSECSHHTCTWVPWSTNRTFQKGSLTYTVDGDDFVIRRSGKELLRAPLKDLSASVSVVWSDDQTHFAVTWSDGGEIGGFHVRAFRVEGDSFIELLATQKAYDVFKAHYWCETRGDNIQAYKWLPDSRSLVLVLSVYPTGDCGKDLGHTEGYVVDAATGDILQHWGIRHLNAYMRAHPEM